MLTLPKCCRRAADYRRAFNVRCLLLLSLLMLSACTTQLPDSSGAGPQTVHLIVDGQNHSLTSETTTVRELLLEAGIELYEADEVNPPLFTPLVDEQTIVVVRVVEETDTLLKSIPFERKIVRNESMGADAPPIILQGGQEGLQEETIRIVYRDGLESERWVTQVAMIEPAQDEIVMIGIGSSGSNFSFNGILAYISDGTAVVLRGLTAFPEQLNSGGSLDGRVFTLSPDGRNLLYTRITTGTSSFNNSLWVIGTERQAEPRQLEINNVLWAGWNPSQANQIAFTTANSTSLPPGWEANNDLWIGDLSPDPEVSFKPDKVVEAYPATYGWWGGNYAWSPTGRYIAYSYANEVGLIDPEANSSSQQHIQLQRFTEYNTLLDWVWVPTLSWSADGRFLAFTNHSSSDPEEMAFDSWVVDVSNGLTGRFVEQSGMWSHLHWTPARRGIGGARSADSQIAFLKSSDPLNSLRSSYTLWLIDQDGSNGRQVFPLPGENSLFPREQQFMAWSPDGRDIAFIFNDALYMLNIDTLESRRITQDDAVSSHPTWTALDRSSPSEPSSDFSDDSEQPIPRDLERLLLDEIP